MPGGARGDQSKVMPPQPGGWQEAVPSMPGMIPSVLDCGGSLGVLREGLEQPRGRGIQGTPGSGHSQYDKKAYKHCGTLHRPPKSHRLNVSRGRRDGCPEGQGPLGGGL